jgi:ribosomal protein RSM22 (predicted rRNA methylase)
MTPELPPALRAAADRLLVGASRQQLAERAARISAQYRAGGASHSVVTSEAEAAAYALTRLPATYAACLHAFAQAEAVAPGFRPRTMLDAGAGPGGASWAACEAWPDLEQTTFLDSNPTFLALARRLAADGPAPMRAAKELRADLAAPAGWPQVDLVAVSYALAEVRPDRLGQTLDALWAATLGLLVIVEPGSPAGFARVLAARTQLIAAGAQILAPCPHEADCPLAQAAPDWCHFSQRLPRSRDHRLAKGGEVPFEDEKFIYLAAARPGVEVAARGARVLAPPRSGKPGVELKLCGPAGLESRFVAKRDKVAHAAVRRLGWGDRLT